MADFKQRGSFGGGNRGGDRGGFNRGGSGGRPRFGGRPSFGQGGRDSGPKEMFSATCANCGKECQVPFRPNGEKPVYCNDCFRSHKEEGSSDFPRRDSRGPSDHFQKRDFKPAFQTRTTHDNPGVSDLKRQIEAINVKLDKIMQAIGVTPAASSSQPKPVEKSEKKNDDTSLKMVVESVMKPVATTSKKVAKKKPAAKKRA